MPKEIPLKEGEHYSRKELAALLEQLVAERIMVKYKDGQVCLSEYEPQPVSDMNANNPVDPRAIKLVLATVWKNLNAGKTLSIDAFVQHMTWDNHWASPTKTKELINTAQELGYIKTEGTDLSLLFDPTTVPNALGMDLAKILGGTPPKTPKPPPPAQALESFPKDPPPAPVRPPETVIPERIKRLKPWVLRRLNNDKCKIHCRTEKNSQKCRECHEWDAFTA